MRFPDETKVIEKYLTFNAITIKYYIEYHVKIKLNVTFIFIYHFLVRRQLKNKNCFMQ